MQKKIITILLVVSFAVLFSCAGNEERQNDKLKITVSIPPYKYLVEKIGGESVDVILTIPKGANPHHYEPEPLTIKQIEKSGCYFLVGGTFEFEQVLFEKMISLSDSLKSVDLSEGIKLIGNDPHIWLSVDNLKIISGNIFSALRKMNPEDSNLYKANYISLIDSLNIVDSLLKSTIQKAGIEHLVVNHSAWKYFARDYGIEEIAVQHGSKNPGIKELMNYIKFVKENNIRFIGTDPQHSTDAVEAITEQVEINIETIDPLPLNPVNEFIKLNNLFGKYYESTGNK